jgi:hypothetical protein
MVKAEMGERLVIVQPFNKDDKYILVRGFIFVHEYPDGIVGNKTIKIHRSPMFWVSQENAWEEYKKLKRMWIDACEAGVGRY